MLPATKYAQSCDVFIAYQISGHGPIDIVFAPGFISHLELMWDEPRHARFLHGLESFARLIRFDKRGTGLSDRSVGFPILDERIDDIRAVMDAAGSSRAVLLGISEGGAMTQLFAATYPERVSGLILMVLIRMRRFRSRPIKIRSKPKLKSWPHGEPEHRYPISPPDLRATLNFSIGGRGLNAFRPVLLRSSNYVR